MNKKQIEGQLKLSKKQNEDERSDYLCSQFNCVDYLIKLEKYTNNLLRKNKKQKEDIDKAIEYINADYVNGIIDGLSWLEVRNLLDILNEALE